MKRDNEELSGLMEDSLLLMANVVVRGPSGPADTTARVAHILPSDMFLSAHKRRIVAATLDEIRGR